MFGDRQTKVAQQLAEHAAAFVRKEANTNPLITITRADVSKDYQNATVFFTTVPEDKQAIAQVFLQRNGGELRRYVMKHMRIKHIPFLTFSVDYGERHRQSIDKISSEIQATKKSSESDEA